MRQILPVILPPLMAAGVLILVRLNGKGDRYHPAAILMMCILPFAAGGFHTYVNAVYCAALLLLLLLTAKKNGGMSLCLNWNTAAIAAIAMGYILTPLWAADRGMAMFGVVKGAALLLSVLLLIQLSKGKMQSPLDLLPVTGAWMTGISLMLLWIPGMTEWVTVNGRLSGFMQYPNSFAVFLLAGLAWNGTKPEKKLLDYGTAFLLMLGIVLSGSRTAFVLLVLLAGCLLARKEEWKNRGLTLGMLLLSVAVSVILSGISQLSDGDRFTTISVSSGTFLARLLYFRDALGLILTHPFGLGSWGYRTVLGGIQTGRYAVSFVHNGLLQLLLDVGWIPAGLLGWVLLRRIFSRKTDGRIRLMLLAVLAHCMLDFDLQFLSIWMILLMGLDWNEGKVHTLSQTGQRLLAGVCTVLTLVSLWLGVGDGLFQMGQVSACLSLTPFHTDALEHTLPDITDPEELEETAGQILALDAQSSIAHSAMANARLSRGDVVGMIESKRQAIACSRYSAEEYCDYIYKLYSVYAAYAKAGDQASAEYCAELLSQVPEMIREVEQSSSKLAYLTGEDPVIELPEEYRQLLALFVKDTD